MKTLRLEVVGVGAAFDGEQGEREEFSRILRIIGLDMANGATAHGDYTHIIRDVNGNRCGTWTLKEGK